MVADREPATGAAHALTARQRRWWLFRKRILPVALIGAGLPLAPFCFSVSGAVVAVVLLNLTGLGVTVGLHRLLSHRSFATYRWVERVLATLGALAFQGGVIDWVAIHKLHHAHTDTDGDPHTPKDSFWRGYILWIFRYDARIADRRLKERYVRDLGRDAYLTFLEDWSIALQALLFLVLYGAGEVVGPGAGLSWAVYGVFVRVAAIQQIAWVVNGASHRWGYRNFATRDGSVNCWWLTFPALGEGWHNNHHACPRSASFGVRWYEFDVGFAAIRLLRALGLAWDVAVPRRELDNGDRLSAFPAEVNPGRLPGQGVAVRQVADGAVGPVRLQVVTGGGRVGEGVGEARIDLTGLSVCPSHAAIPFS
jgi:stearoyl-CoA desaturase (delta-9 desaturase)